MYEDDSKVLLSYNELQAYAKGMKPYKNGNYTSEEQKDARAMAKKVFQQSRSSDYMIDLSGDDHIQLIHKKETPSNECGWKLHVAIDDSDKVNMEKGSDIVLELLFQFEIKRFKIIRNEVTLANSSEEAITGNQITIYCDKENKIEWSELINNIENNLSNEKIKPAKKSCVDKQIDGSNHISFRNDSYNGKFISTKELIDNKDIKEADRANPDRLKDDYDLNTIKIDNKSIKATKNVKEKLNAIKQESDSESDNENNQDSFCCKIL